MVAQVLTQSNALSEAVDSVVSESIDGLPDSTLGGDLVDIRRQIDRLEGEFLRRLHRFDRSPTGRSPTVRSARCRGCAPTAGSPARWPRSGCA